MTTQLLKYLSVAALSAFKVLPGLGLAMGYQFNALELFLTLGIGSMVGVTAFTLLGTQIRQWIQHRRKSKSQTLTSKKIRKIRRILNIWRRFGIWGIAFLTPPLISPPFGALIAVAFREDRRRILLTMFASIVFWCGLFAILGEQILTWIEVNL